MLAVVVVVVVAAVSDVEGAVVAVMNKFGDKHEVTAAQGLSRYCNGKTKTQVVM